MRDADRRSEGLFSYASRERRAPAGHPLRAILPPVDGVPAGLSPEFRRLHALNGRPSIAPGKLRRALLARAFHSARSERRLTERLGCNLLFRWFAGLGVDDPVWDATVLTKNRDRLLDGGIAAKSCTAVLARPELDALLPDGHVSVDGTPIRARASTKGFRPKDGSGEPPAPGRDGGRDLKGEKRSNETHASTSDADARLFREGDGAAGRPAGRLCFIGHALMENRDGSAVGGKGEDAQLRLLSRPFG